MLCLRGVPQDIDDLQNFGLVHKVDYIAASFVRKPEDIDTIRMILGEEGAHIKVNANSCRIGRGYALRGNAFVKLVFEHHTISHLFVQVPPSLLTYCVSSLLFLAPLFRSLPEC